MTETPRQGRHFKARPASSAQPEGGSRVQRPATRPRVRRAGRQTPMASPNPTGALYDTGSYEAHPSTRTASASTPYGRNTWQKPVRRRGGSRIVSNVLIIVGIVLLLVAGGLWLHAQLEYRAQDEVNAKLASYATVSDDDAQQVGPQVDWAGLRAVNDEAVAWIQIPGTNVNYPVYQTSDNEKYLHTTAEGEYSIGGQIFMDFENTAPGLQDMQTLVYGHHLYNGTMFTAVDDMMDQATLDATDTVWYVTDQTTYELEPLFAYRTPATNADARKISFASPDEFHTYLSGLLAQASSKTDRADAAVKSVTKVLTLSTCDYNNDFGAHNGRGLLVCALKSEVDAAQTGGSS